MDMVRRNLVAASAALPASSWITAWADMFRGGDVAAPEQPLVLSDFRDDSGYVLPGAGWRGFSDRVMGGISTAALNSDFVAGKHCIRLTGDVTRESNGGFIQMALYFGRNYEVLNGSAYRGVELLVYGNNEDYNVHVRTADCGWHDQSYRATIYARDMWQRVRIPWSEFKANNVPAELDAGTLSRIAILGWMREFEADISLAQISLYV